MTAEEFVGFMSEIGMKAELIKGADNVEYIVVRDLIIPNGGLKGRRCDVAIQKGGVPFLPAAAIHTRPALVEMKMMDPLKTQGSGIGSDWQYWSRRFDKVPTPKNLWTHILTILCDPRWTPV